MKFGISSATITVEIFPDCGLDGMPRKAPVEGVLDELEVVVCVLDDGKQPAVLAFIDCLFLTTALHKELSDIAGSLVPGAVLLAHATHCHSADLHPLDTTTQAASEVRRHGTQAKLHGFASALRAAISSSSPCEIAGAQIPFPGNPTSNRRVKLDLGCALSAFGAGPFIPPSHRCLGAAGPDPGSIDLLAFRDARTGKLKGVLTSHASHIHFHPLSLVTGESAAAARRELRERHPQIHFAFSLGCAGDIANQACVPPVGGSTEALRQSQLDGQKEFARLFADAVDRALPGLRFEAAAPVRFSHHDESGSHPGEHLALDVLRLGPAAIVSLPGEVFFDFDAALRAARPGRSIFLAAYNRSKLGYVASPAAFEEGSYEVMRGPSGIIPYASLSLPPKSSPFTGARIVALAHDLLARVFNESERQHPASADRKNE